MQKIKAELIFASGENVKKINRAEAAGKLRRIARGIYTGNTQDSFEVIMRRNAPKLIGHLFPGAVVSHRSAHEIGHASREHVFISGDYRKNRNVALPGITFHILGSPKDASAVAQESDIKFMNFYVAARPRYLLECLQPSRGPEEGSKALPRATIENILAETRISGGEEALKKLLEEAKKTAPKLALEKELAELESMIGAILGTHNERAIKTPGLIEKARGSSYDLGRLGMFENLALALIEVKTPEQLVCPNLRENTKTLETLSFMEAYFSNHIEGTEFEIDEARDIVFENKISQLKPEDSHDVLNTYKLLVDSVEMSKTPESRLQFIELLKERHGRMMGHRTTINPGRFKELANRAGNTRFVEPHLVKGTLEQSFDLYKTLPNALARAIFMQIVVAEVHPFNDGNGRMARVMMNVELMKANECRIIIPTVFLDDYITALKAFSQSNLIDPTIKMFARAQKFSASMNYGSYQEAKDSFTGANAFLEHKVGQLRFIQKWKDEMAQIKNPSGNPSAPPEGSPKPK